MSQGGNINVCECVWYWFLFCLLSEINKIIWKSSHFSAFQETFSALSSVLRSFRSPCSVICLLLMLHIIRGINAGADDLKTHSLVSVILMYFCSNCRFEVKVVSKGLRGQNKQNQLSKSFHTFAEDLVAFEILTIGSKGEMVRQMGEERVGIVRAARKGKCGREV